MGSDVLMLPVGGYYTIDAAEAEKIVDAVCPRTVLPMHYRFGEHGMDVLSEVTAFTGAVSGGARHPGGRKQRYGGQRDAERRDSFTI